MKKLVGLLYALFPVSPSGFSSLAVRKWNTASNEKLEEIGNEATVIILKIRQNFNNYCCRCRFFRVKHDVNGHNFDRFSNT